MNAIKVFLVEDEIIIRRGIKESISWEKEGYQFAGEVSDGELAYPLILKEKPDILITDIRMPFMDGLELSRLVRQELPDIKILILSGYDEFEYAKEAIKIGVAEYLLKPVSSVKLLETLGEVRQTILREREEKELLLRYQQEMRENTEREKIKLFDQLILGELSASEVVEIGKRYHMNLSAPCYQIVLFKILAGGSNPAIPEQVILACERIEEAAAQMDHVYEFQRGVDGWAFLLTAEGDDQMEQVSAAFGECLHQIMAQHPQIEYFGGIGGSVSRIRSLRESFSEADKAFAARFTFAANQIISLKDMQKQYEEEKLQVKGFIQVSKSRELLEKFLNNGTQEEVDSFCDAYLDQMEKNNMRSAMVRQYTVVDICIVILAFCEKLDPENDLQNKTEDLQTIMQKYSSLSGIRKDMIRLLHEAIELRDTVSGRRYSDIILAAQEKIAGQYMTEEISLNTVAASVGMSPSYFSSIFSKEVGRTFVEYLTETRMEKAREYLMCSAMKTSEIGYEVGYKDPHYFSYIFKKTQGCSPKEYRARRKE